MLLRLVHTRGVATTSPCNKLWGQVPLCELAIFASESSCRDQSLVSTTTPTNSSQSEFLASLFMEICQWLKIMGQTFLVTKILVVVSKSKNLGAT